MTSTKETIPSSSFSKPLLNQKGMEWADAMAHTAEQVGRAKEQLENQFLDASDLAKENGHGSIPNLVDVIRRIEKLDRTMTQLQGDCKAIDEERNALIPAAVEQALKNQTLLKELLNNAQIPATRDEEWESNDIKEKLRSTVSAMSLETRR